MEIPVGPVSLASTAVTQALAGAVAPGVQALDWGALEAMGELAEFADSAAVRQAATVG